MLSRTIARSLLTCTKFNACRNNMRLATLSSRSINHIKNMLDEQLKYQVEELTHLPVVEQTTRVYKPSYTIEFDRVGEVLLFSCDPFKHMAIYFKYPYVLYESFIPISIWLFYMNPLELEWYYNYINLGLINILWIPRLWYFKGLNHRIVKMSMLRGGKAVKVETHSLSGDRNFAWVENYNFQPLTEDQKNFDDRDQAEFLTEEGQLKYDLATQLDNFTEFAVNQQDVVIYFLKEGTVHHPEIFEAVCKGYNVDTSDFVINTAHNLRAREGTTNF